MNRAQRYGASQSHSSCCEMLGHRRATDEAPGSEFLCQLRIPSLKNQISPRRGRVQPSGVALKVFQHGLQDGYLSLNPHGKGGLFPLMLMAINSQVIKLTIPIYTTRFSQNLIEFHSRFVS